ncbi:MAG: TIR domain-containing protein [Bacteroidetes bacterium]|nr:TIR domain-containing protein [Bacteroidota bacterium]
MADIFISYSRKDSEQALALADRLRSSGADVWMDTASLTAAETWSAEIVSAIRSCHTFIVMLSPNSVTSKNVVKEVGLASERDKRIIPIVLEPCVLSDAMQYALAGIHHVKINDRDALDRALSKIGLVATTPVAEAPSDPVSAFPDNLIRIAVLPFDDQSPAHDHEWFSDGLTDELILTLNKLDALFVLDRKSSQLYKDARISVKQIAAELNVRYIISGAVRKAGQNIRVQVSLIEATSGVTLWDEKFSGTMDDIFEIQERTAFDIAEGLKLKLTPAEMLLLEEKTTTSSEAYRLLLQAREKNNSFADSAGAIEDLKHAIRIDPGFLPAYAILSVAYANEYRSSNRTNATLLDLSKRAMDEIRQIDPNSPFYYGPCANYYLNIGERELALDMANKLVELRPKQFVSYAILGFMQDSLGNYREAMRAFQRAIELDPATATNYVKLATAAFRLGEMDAIEWCWEKGRPLYERLIAAHPERMWAKLEYLFLSLFAGYVDIAVEMAESIERLPDLPLETHTQLAAVWMANGQIERGTKALQYAIDGGYVAFEGMDRRLYRAIEGTPLYQFVLDHIVRP